MAGGNRVAVVRGRVCERWEMKHGRRPLAHMSVKERESRRDDGVVVVECDGGGAGTNKRGRK